MNLDQNNKHHFLSVEKAAQKALNSARIAVVGNTCSGKTVFSKKLESLLKLPLVHVDSVQFVEDLQLRNPDETRLILKKYAEGPQWIIDGVGPLKILEDRLCKADLIVVLRPPILLNLLYLLKRQFTLIFKRRAELPAHSRTESTPNRTFLLFKHMLNVHQGLWPQLDRILFSKNYNQRVLYINSSDEKNIFFEYLHHANS